MAFKDITKVMYDGKIKLDYKDKAHRYYARPRVNFDLPEDNPKAWGKIMYPKGTTTLLGDTLEKKGLMTWPMGLALRELFGFYDFEGDKGRMTGFSKGVGSLRNGEAGIPAILDDESLLEAVLSASKAWQRKQQKGADIGSVVHDAIEHFVLVNPGKPEPVLDKKGEPTGKTAVPAIRDSGFDIGEQYMWNIKEAITDVDSPEFSKAMEDFPSDVEQATLAFNAFVEWWTEVRPILNGAEEILYSLEHNVCGTYDGDVTIPISAHPVPEMFKGKKAVRCVADWKTSNASKSAAAAMPEGVNYQYFIQSAIYEMIRREMGHEHADDLLIVSARKDGGFTLVYASELGMTIDDCIAWAKCVITCYRAMEKAKIGLIDHAKAVEEKPNSEEAF